MQYRPLFFFCTLVASAALHAGTVFTPTDGDINFLFDELGGATLAMFDDNDFGGEGLIIPVPSTVGIFGPTGSGDYIATSETPATLLLSGSSQFVLGITLDGGVSWIEDSGVTPFGANAYSVSFPVGNSVFAVDVVPVPAPASVWLFGSALLGSAAIARRRSLKSS